MAVAVTLSACAGREPTELSTNEVSPTSTATSASAPPTTTVASSTISPVEALPPTTTSRGQSEPIGLEALGPNVWWIAGYDTPDQVVEVDPVTGEILRTVWKEVSSEGPESGRTLACREVSGAVQAVELVWSIDGPMREIYNERVELNGEVIARRSIDVDGTSLPVEVNEVCGHPRSPTVRVTALQLLAVLSRAGLTDIEGDHAIDPVWEATAWWDGIRYWPLGLFQGDFRPTVRPGTELLECRMGGLELSTDLPADARSRLVDLAGCSGI